MKSGIWKKERKNAQNNYNNKRVQKAPKKAMEDWKDAPRKEIDGFFSERKQQQKIAYRQVKELISQKHMIGPLHRKGLTTDS